MEHKIIFGGSYVEPRVTKISGAQDLMTEQLYV